MIGICQGVHAVTPSPRGGEGVASGAKCRRRAFANRSCGPWDQTSICCLGPLANQPAVAEDSVWVRTGRPRNSQDGASGAVGSFAQSLNSEARQVARRYDSWRLFFAVWPQPLARFPGGAARRSPQRRRARGVGEASFSRWWVPERGIVGSLGPAGSGLAAPLEGTLAAVDGQ
jgi:hypothetical protein